MAESFTFVQLSVAPAGFEISFCILQSAVLRAASIVNETFTASLFLIIWGPKVAGAQSLGWRRFVTDGCAVLLGPRFAV